MQGEGEPRAACLSKVDSPPITLKGRLGKHGTCRKNQEGLVTPKVDGEPPARPLTTEAFLYMTIQPRPLIRYFHI